MSNALIVKNEMDIMTLGNVLSKSGYFSDSKQAAQAVVKVLAGQELGFGPVASMTGIHIIQGKVSLGSNLLAAAIKRSGRYNYRVLDHTNDGCKIQFYENNEPVGVSEFTKTDAQAAGVLSKDNWKKFPRNMYFSRALSNGQKWYCPDVGNGAPLYTPEELGVDVDGETGNIVDAPAVVVEQKPKPAPKRSTKTMDGMTALKMLDIVNAETSDHYKDVTHMRNAIRKAIGEDNWGWPAPSDNEKWQEAEALAIEHAIAPQSEPSLDEIFTGDK